MLKSRTLLLFAWIVSIVATLGSLYLSEIAGFTPCKLCWFQRIFMYPQSILLGIAYFRKDKNIVYYIIPMAVIGGCISIFHYLEQKTSLLEGVKTCTVGIPCSTQHLNYLGFITIPFMALTASVLILLSLLLFHKKNQA